MGGIFPRHAQDVVRETHVLSPAEQATLGRRCRPRGRARRDGRGKETGNGDTAHSLRLAPAL